MLTAYAALKLWEGGYHDACCGLLAFLCAALTSASAATQQTVLSEGASNMALISAVRTVVKVNADVLLAAIQARCGLAIPSTAEDWAFAAGIPHISIDYPFVRE